MSDVVAKWSKRLGVSTASVQKMVAAFKSPEAFDDYMSLTPEERAALKPTCRKSITEADRVMLVAIAQMSDGKIHILNVAELPCRHAKMRTALRNAGFIIREFTNGTQWAVQFRKKGGA